jgi:flagellin-like protein
MKGISAVIAVILLLLITISITGVAFIFFSRTQQSVQNATEQQLQHQTSLFGTQFVIDAAGPGFVYLRNLGTVTLSNLAVYSNNVKVNTAVPTIQPGAVAKIEVPLEAGMTNVKISSAASQGATAITLGSTAYDFDSFDAGPGSSDDWFSRNGVDPDITSTTSFKGTYSLHMPSSWGGNFEFGSGEPSSPASYDTNTYRYMCMAYKIPSTTRANMLINVAGANPPTGGWVSVTMTQGETCATYPKVASWNKDISGNSDTLTADSNWHYKCIDIDSQLDASLGAVTHTVNAVIWHDGGCNLGSVTGEFWIDEFMIV